MTEPFDFPAWLAATGWTNAEAARELGLTPESVGRLLKGQMPVTDRTAGRCRDAASRLIKRVQPFAE